MSQDIFDKLYEKAMARPSSEESLKALLLCLKIIEMGPENRSELWPRCPNIKGEIDGKK
jgi:hypothetical protein